MGLKMGLRTKSFFYFLVLVFGILIFVELVSAAGQPPIIDFLSASMNSNQTSVTIIGRGVTACTDPCRRTDTEMTTVDYSITGPVRYDGPSECFDYNNPGCTGPGGSWTYTDTANI